jgi:hypothetical protein
MRCSLRYVALLTTISLSSAFAAAAATEVELSFITDKGWIRFTVGGDWKVLNMDTKNSVRFAVFQLPNPADEGTPDSTNASVTSFELDSPQASQRYAHVRQKYAKGSISRTGGWEIFKTDFQEGSTDYSGRVGFRDIADVHACIVFAWPHLKKNAASYDSNMEQTFQSLLNSVTGALGKYPERGGEVLRHPE